MFEVDAWLNQFDADLPALREEGETLRSQLEALIGATDVKLHAITMRLKSREALRKKLLRPDRTYQHLHDVTDLVGLRVTTYFEDAVERVARLIEQSFQVDFERSIDKRDASAFGYRSVHYICERAGRGRFEIQVRSLLQHAWAEIEHDLGYKSEDAIPQSVRRRFSRIAGLLEIADHEFLEVRRELEQYARDLPERMRKKDAALSLDRLSLVSLLDSPLLQAVDAEVARLTALPLAASPFFPDYLLRMLQLAGVQDVASLLNALEIHRDATQALVAPYFRFAREQWGLQPPQIDRGYGLFFLAHVLVLQGAELGLGQTERLAQFYHALDYPNDPRTAHRIASGLLTAFRQV